jgi:hypothetical protein
MTAALCAALSNPAFDRDAAIAPSLSQAMGIRGDR